MTVVVSYNEGEDWILHEVIERTTCQFVQLHQILKVGNLALLPTACTCTCGCRGDQVEREERECHCTL